MKDKFTRIILHRTICCIIFYDLWHVFTLDAGKNQHQKLDFRELARKMEKDEEKKKTILSESYIKKICLIFEKENILAHKNLLGIKQDIYYIWRDENKVFFPLKWQANKNIFRVSATSEKTHDETASHCGFGLAVNSPFELFPGLMFRKQTQRRINDARLKTKAICTDMDWIDSVA